MDRHTLIHLNGDDFNRVLDEKLQRLQQNAIYARYTDREVSVNTVAEIHGVTRQTVTKYANAGRIPHRKDGKLFKFSLSTILQLDFHQLRTA